MLVISSMEITYFFTCLVVFIVAICKRKKRVDLKTYVMLFSLITAFITHGGFLWHSWKGPEACREMHWYTSFIFFLPQAIFFLIFIWTIFKLLLVFRGMTATSEEESLIERNRIRLL